MKWSENNSIPEILDQKVDIEYQTLEEQENWKVEMIKEIIDAKEGDADTSLDFQQMNEILKYLCTA